MSTLKRSTIERQERAAREAERAEAQRAEQAKMRDSLVFLEARTFDRFIQSKAETQRLEREHAVALQALERFGCEPIRRCPVHGTPIPCEFHMCRTAVPR